MSDGVKTFMEANPPVRFDTVCDGALPELFSQEMERALKNVLDINTPHSKKRVVTLTLTLEANEERNEVEITVEASSKLAGTVAAGGRIYCAATANGGVVAVCHNPKQMQFPGMTAQPRLVTEPAATVAPAEPRQAAGQ